MSVLYMWWLLAFTAALPSCHDYVRAKIKELNVTRNWFGALLFFPLSSRLLVVRQRHDLGPRYCRVFQLTPVVRDIAVLNRIAK